jgi:hypothetical protein
MPSALALSSIALASRFFSLMFSSSGTSAALRPIRRDHVARLTRCSQPTSAGRHRPLPPQYSNVLLFREPARLHVHPFRAMDTTRFLDKPSGLNFRWDQRRPTGHFEAIHSPGACANTVRDDDAVRGLPPHHAIFQRATSSPSPLFRGHHREAHRYGDQPGWWKRAGQLSRPECCDLCLICRL